MSGFAFTLRLATSYAPVCPVIVKVPAGVKDPPLEILAMPQRLAVGRLTAVPLKLTAMAVFGVSPIITTSPLEVLKLPVGATFQDPAVQVGFRAVENVPILYSLPKILTTLGNGEVELPFKEIAPQLLETTDLVCETPVNTNSVAREGVAPET